MIFKEQTKSIPITKEMVWASYKKVKRNRGSAGIDQQSLSDFDRIRSEELYKVWNRLASGSYFAPAIKRVNIPKAGGKTRPLGIPTVSDRIAQQVIKEYLEPRLESIFSDNSYGYRPNRNAHLAIEKVRYNVRYLSWVIDLDIQEFFENVNHSLLLKALERHVSEKWVLLYIKRWLEAPVILEDGTVKTPNGKGTPQGGVISPLLANLYLHYCVDKWLEKYHPSQRMVRYADDLIIHCRSNKKAVEILTALKSRLEECDLKAHPEKTKIVYCKKDGRNLKGYPVQFDFLGFSFQPIRFKLKRGGSFLQFDCKMSRKSKVRITRELRELAFHNKTQRGIQDLAKGWIQYYGKISRRSLQPVFYYLHNRMIRWILNKYKSFKGSKVKAAKWLRQITRGYPNLFYHWELGYKLV
ncbi:group II intron reverse transcriptase/maturase [Salegentibacter echinorum]|uniref:RNA-directed DNA polymerase n=1 Tax=Salegentibacter echinorum TaxID=1073325 RepID=A0A1M5JK38_SALEC|nr:group II intron reverse transcriptase/maturase [Salegentibacter echinorum]SHG40403.1 group II intron reverse transcriptase/maturase [Salegentibacter echinorum]